jgi:HlyD family secretion protein
VNQRVALAVALATLAAGFWWSRVRNPAPVEWQGYAEADYVKVGPTLEGLLTSVFVARGTKVAAERRSSIKTTSRTGQPRIRPLAN